MPGPVFEIWWKRKPYVSILEGNSIFVCQVTLNRHKTIVTEDIYGLYIYITNDHLNGQANSLQITFDIIGRCRHVQYLNLADLPLLLEIIEIKETGDI